MEVIFVAVFAVAFVLLLKMSGKSRRERLLEALPGPNGYPLFGNFFDVVRKEQDFLRLSTEYTKKFGSVYKTWFGSTPVVHVSKPEHVELILSTDGIVGEVDPNCWIIHLLDHRPRANMTRARDSKKAEAIIDACHEHLDSLLDRLEQRDVSDNYLTVEHISLCALDIIFGIFFDFESGFQKGSNSTTAASLIKFMELSGEYKPLRHFSEALFRMTTFGSKYILHRDVIRNFLDEIPRGKLVAESRTTSEIHSIVNSALSDIQLSVRLVAYVLAHEPTVQARILEEIDNAIKRDRGGEAGRVTMAELRRMKYFDRVLQETFRLFPSRPFILKQLKKEAKIGSHTIPCDTIVCVQVMSLHRDRHLFSNDRFEPDNFLPSKIAARSRFAYIPKGDERIDERHSPGPNLIDMSVKLMLTRLIKKFVFEKNDKSRGVDIASGVYPDEHDLRIRLAPRESR